MKKYELTSEAHERITRKEVEEEIREDRIRDALGRRIDGDEVRDKWMDMKQRKTTVRRRTGGGETDMLKELRGLDIERTDLDEMVALSAFGRDMKAEYDRLVIPIPEWLEGRLEELDRETRLRRTDALEKKLKELTAREDALKTADQKRTDVAAEKAKILAALGKTG